MVWNDVSAFLAKHRPKRKRDPAATERTPSSCCGGGSKTRQRVTADAFLHSQWSKLPWWFFPSFYCLSTLYFSFWLIASWISFKDNKKGKGKWFIFLTNWSFATLVLHIYCITVPIVRNLLLPRIRRRPVTVQPASGTANDSTQEQSVSATQNDSDAADIKVATPAALPAMQLHFQQVNLEDDTCMAEKTLVVTDEAVVERHSGQPTLQDSLSTSARGMAGNAFRSGLGFAHRLSWVLDNIAATMAIGVTIAFWSFLYDKKQPVNSVTVHTHGVNAAFVLADQLLCRRPRRLAHVVQPVAFGLCYVAFTVLYYLSGGTDPFGRHYVYPFLDWARPLHALSYTVLFAVVLTAIIFLLTYVVFRVRSYVHGLFFDVADSDSLCGRRHRPLLLDRHSLSSVCANAVEQEINEFLQIKV